MSTCVCSHDESQHDGACLVCACEHFYEAPNEQLLAVARNARHELNASLDLAERRRVAERKELLAALKDMVDLHEHEPQRPAVAYAREVIARAEAR